MFITYGVRIAAQEIGARIKTLSNENIAAEVQEVARIGVSRVGTGVDDVVPLPRVQRTYNDPVAFGMAGKVRRQIKEVLAVREENGPAVAEFVGVDGRYRGRRPACGGNAEQAAIFVGGE